MVLTLPTGAILDQCLSRNYVQSGNERVCIKELKGEELEAYYYVKRLNRLKRALKRADRSVARGYDPDVSVAEFSRRLDKRSDLQDQLREMQ